MMNFSPLSSVVGLLSSTIDFNSNVNSEFSSTVGLVRQGQVAHLDLRTLICRVFGFDPDLGPGRVLWRNLYFLLNIASDYTHTYGIVMTT